MRLIFSFIFFGVVCSVSAAATEGAAHSFGFQCAFKQDLKGKAFLAELNSDWGNPLSNRWLKFGLFERRETQVLEVNSSLKGFSIWFLPPAV